MLKNKVKLDKELLKRAEKYAITAGYASLDEFLNHIVEKELSKIDTNDESIEEVEKRLKGLGYIS